MTFKIPMLFSLLVSQIFTLQAQDKVVNRDGDFEIRIIANKLSDPWELTFGPDNLLWLTEAKGYRVLQIDPATGKRHLLLDLNSQRSFPRYDQISDTQDGGKPWPQGGLMGLALHPSLLTGKPFVYLAYIFSYKGAAAKDDGKQGNEGYQYVLKIVRYTYSQKKGLLSNAVTLCDTVPASNDHNGGRLAIAQHNGKAFLFYSIGDMGAGQFTNGGRTNKAQNAASYEGKILRFNLEPDQHAKAGEEWIPADNPFNNSRRNAVWTLGHRNPQGLAYAKINGKDLLYSTEHGPYSDDEVNIIEKGRNYGHPLIIGYDDGNYNGLAASVSDNAAFPGKWHTSYPLVTDEHQNAIALGNTYKNPIKSFYPTAHDTLNVLFNNIQLHEKGSWESFAPSSIEVYQSDAIPGWKNSLLIPTLKGARLLRLALDENGNIATDQVFEYIKGNVRYRDVAVSRDGLKIYLAVDSSSVSSGPSKMDPKQISYRGCILEMKYKVNAKMPAKQSSTNQTILWKTDKQKHQKTH